jgi:hypothetical protein
MRCALILTAAAVLAGLAGCATTTAQCGPGCVIGTCADAPETCASCTAGCNHCTDPGAMAYDPAACHGTGMHCGLGSRRWRDSFTPGPPAGQITYPYYTTRGPRDFLASNPRSVGP